MKRAEVWKGHYLWHPGGRPWIAQVWTREWDDHMARTDFAATIEDDPEYTGTWHPTHAAALAHALAEVGLTEKNTEKETNR